MTTRGVRCVCLDERVAPCENHYWRFLNGDKVTLVWDNLSAPTSQRCTPDPLSTLAAFLQIAPAGRRAAGKERLTYLTTKATICSKAAASASSAS
jgi:hypothetical protein